MRSAFLAALVAVGGMSPAIAAETAPPDPATLIDDSVLRDIRNFVNTEIVRYAISAHNRKYAQVSQGGIADLDAQWVAELSLERKPLIAATLSNPLSVYLARVQGRSVGLYIEIFAMNDKGLNAGQSSITSDFWQGDEAKFQQTYPKGANAVHLGAPEWDDAFKIWRSQVSLTVTEPGSRRPIGAVTVDLNLTELDRRQRRTGI